MIDLKRRWKRSGALRRLPQAAKCDASPSHSYREPAIRFYGTSSDGFRALAVVRTFGLPVYALRRFWQVNDGEVTGPQWEITFFPLSALKRRQREAERAG